MWFLTKLWVPFWLWTALMEWYMSVRHGVNQRGMAALTVFVWFGINFLVTLVYVCTRIFRRATADSGTRR